MDIHPADKQHRRRLAVWLVLLALGGCLLLWSLEAWLAEIVLRLEGRDPSTVRAWLRWLLAGLATMLAVPPLLLGRALRGMGRAADRERRFPPSAWKTVRDVRILRGDDAARWARRVERAGNVAIALAGALLGLALWSVWHFG